MIETMVAIFAVIYVLSFLFTIGVAWVGVLLEESLTLDTLLRIILASITPVVNTVFVLYVFFQEAQNIVVWRKKK